MAVIEHVAKDRTKYSVELKPSILKSLLDTQKLVEFLQQEMTSASRHHQSQMADATIEIGGLKLDLSEAESYSERLEANNAILMRKLAQTPDERPTERSEKSHMNRVQEKGLRPGVRGISGGLPSLGKRK